MRCGFKKGSSRLLLAFAGCVRHLFGARMCVYCASCLGATGYSIIMWTATQASFITHVALTDERDANGLLPTATARVAAFYSSAHMHARTLNPRLWNVHFLQNKWALNGLNRCVLTDSRSVGSLLLVHRGTLKSYVAWGAREALALGPPLCFYLSTSSPNQNGACIYGRTTAHLLLNKWQSWRVLYIIIGTLTATLNDRHTVFHYL